MTSVLNIISNIKNFAFFSFQLLLLKSAFWFLLFFSICTVLNVPLISMSRGLTIEEIPLKMKQMDVCSKCQRTADRMHRDRDNCGAARSQDAGRAAQWPGLVTHLQHCRPTSLKTDHNSPGCNSALCYSGLMVSDDKKLSFANFLFFANNHLFPPPQGFLTQKRSHDPDLNCADITECEHMMCYWKPHDVLLETTALVFDFRDLFSTMSG